MTTGRDKRKTIRKAGGEREDMPKAEGVEVEMR